MNKNYYYIAIVSLICTFFGFAYYIINNEWVIIKLNNNKEKVFVKKACKSPFILYYWQNDQWHSESKELIDIKDNKAKTIEYLISSWLGLLDEEQILSKKVSLQSVMVDSTGQEVFISFDRSLFDKNSSIKQKWYLIESLLRTLRANISGIQKVYVLVHNQLINDDHLDFSQGWPISGFIKNLN